MIGLKTVSWKQRFGAAYRSTRLRVPAVLLKFR